MEDGTAGGGGCAVDGIVDERGDAGSAVFAEELGLCALETVGAVSAEEAEMGAEFEGLAAAGSPGDAEAGGEAVVLEGEAGVEVAEAGGRG